MYTYVEYNNLRNKPYATHVSKANRENVTDEKVAFKAFQISKDQGRSESHDALMVSVIEQTTKQALPIPRTVPVIFGMKCRDTNSSP